MQIPPLALKTGAITLAVSRSFVGHKTNNFEGKKNNVKPSFFSFRPRTKKERFFAFLSCFLGNGMSSKSLDLTMDIMHERKI